jgi:predicted alpha/beta-fold hydrolase
MGAVDVGGEKVQKKSRLSRTIISPEVKPFIHLRYCYNRVPANNLKDIPNLMPDAFSQNQQLAQSKIVMSDFKPPWWATNRHVQTIYPRFFKRRAKIKIRHQRLPLPDNDFVNLAWIGEPNAAKGIVALFHGLEGSINSHYAHDMAANLQEQGYLVVLMHFRGCGGEQNLRPRAYHSGETEDAWYFLNWLEQQYPALKKVAIGYSLGANMLLKLLGEQVQQNILQAAVAISPPFRLEQCAASIDQGFSRFYQSYLLKSMVNNLLTKMQTIDYEDRLQITQEQAKKLKNFREFDEHVTAPVHGFANADDYYQRCSAVNFLKNIITPTLILHAIDDPFMNQEVLPREDELSANVRLEISEKGGHVGFMQGSPWQPRIWTHRRVNDFIVNFLGESSVQNKSPA